MIRRNPKCIHKDICEYYQTLDVIKSCYKCRYFAAMPEGIEELKKAIDALQMKLDGRPELWSIHER